MLGAPWSPVVNRGALFTPSDVMFEAFQNSTILFAAFLAACIYIVVRAWRSVNALVDWGHDMLETLREIKVLGQRLADHDARITRLEIAHNEQDS